MRKLPQTLAGAFILCAIASNAGVVVAQPAFPIHEVPPDAAFVLPEVDAALEVAVPMVVRGSAAALADLADLAGNLRVLDRDDGVAVALVRDPMLRRLIRQDPDLELVDPPSLEFPAPPPSVLTGVPQASPAATGPPGVLPFYHANGPDVFRQNGQWYHYATGAARPVPDAGTLSGYSPEWQLDVTGRGATVGIVDTGTPSIECGKVLLGFLTDAGETVTSYLADVWPVLVQAGLVDFYLAPGYWRPTRLHPDFDWYQPGRGGFVPTFQSYSDYVGYRDGTLNLTRINSAVGTAAWLMAPLLDAWGWHLLGYLVDGEICPTADPRLPAPETLTWAPLPEIDYFAFNVDLPFDEASLLRDDAWQGYDANGELRVILDPYIGGLDRDVSGHGTAVAGPMASRLRPEQSWGGMRGLAPDAKYIGYNTAALATPWPPDRSGIDALRQLISWRRAPIDEVQVLSNSWWSVATGPMRASSLEPDGRIKLWLEMRRQAGIDAMNAGVLVVQLTNNDATDLDRLWSDGTAVEVGRLTTLAAGLPDASSLVVGGTAPRDYLWFTGTPRWMPDAAGKLDDRQYNLDRPMIFWFGPGLEPGGTGFGTAVDIVAPSGAYPRMDCAPDDLVCIRSIVSNLFYSTSRVHRPGINIGSHDYNLGTSYAAPQVAATAALLIEAYAEVRGVAPASTTLRNILARTADDQVGPRADLVAHTTVYPAADVQLSVEVIDRPGKDQFMGHGRLDIPGAIEAARR